MKGKLAPTLNSSFNNWLTICVNGNQAQYPTKTQLYFLKKGYSINIIRKDVFCNEDFTGITNDYFRVMVYKLKPFLDIVIPGRPKFYKLKGIHVDNLTIEGTRVNKVTPDFDEILSKLKHQPPYIHDVKISATTSELYVNLLTSGFLPHEKNKQIFLSSDNLPIKSRFEISVSIAPNGNILVSLGCSLRPVPYSLEGWNEVIAVLSQLTYVLSLRAHFDCLYPPPIDQWRVVYYHWNKDGIISNSSSFHYQIHDLQAHSQTYIKKFPNGKKALRYEEHKTQNRTIKEEQEKAGQEQEKYEKCLDDSSELYDEDV